jgi:hypothetical protein
MHDSNPAATFGYVAGERVGDGFLQGGGVEARVLADIECVEVKAEGADLEDERINEGAGDAQAAILFERGAQGVQVVEEFVDGAVGGEHLGELLLSLGESVGGDGERGVGRAGMLHGALDAGLEADDEAAVILELVLLAEDLGLGGVDLGDVGPEAIE